MANVLSDVLATYTTIDSNYTNLLNACTTDQQRSALKTQYEAAQNAYYACVDQTLEGDDAEISALSAQLKAANAQVQRSVTELGDMSKVINGITTAVSIAAQLAAKVPA